jgi:hypothetical protein
MNSWKSLTHLGKRFTARLLHITWPIGYGMTKSSAILILGRVWGSRLSGFVAWVDARSVWMAFVHDIANGTKHLRKKQTFETMRVVSLPFSFDTPRAGFDEGTWGGPIRYVQGSPRQGRHGIPLA